MTIHTAYVSIVIKKKIIEKYFNVHSTAVTGPMTLCL